MEKINLNLHQRLIAVLDHLGCDKNISKFAKALGVNSQNISNIYNKKTIPKLNLIAKIATQYPDQINYHWLLTGNGQMLRDVIIIDPTNDRQDVFLDGSKAYHNAYLLQLQDKDQQIIALQKELNIARQKTIDLLERYLEQ